MDSLFRINVNILQSMTSTHHVIVVCLLAYLIRYCSGACYYDSSKLFPKTCITSPINAALNRKIVASNTCGNPPEGFCYIGPQRQCEICNENHPNQSHPAKLMVDQFSLTEVTWWQSQTWWASNQLGLSKMFGPLKVIITLDIKKKYLISGGIYVTFKTERPKKMIIEKSSNFGQTWNVYQYYAKNCRSAYNLQPDPAINPYDPFKPVCSEVYSGEFPRSGGVVHFDPRTRYRPTDYYNDNVDKYLEATNIRLKLEYPGTDGREYINEESTLNQYFYAISDIRVDARCDCNGHSEYCDNLNGVEQCDCQHYTEGLDCSSCKPLYRNKMWMAGNATNANPCQKCECYDHATSCTYNGFLYQGVCDDCIHNTRGIECGQCNDRFYRNLSLPLNSPEVCTPCNCYNPGIQDDGKCLQAATNTHQLGQCNCKPGIYGRRCDQCIPGKWGYVTPPVGTCFDCACNMYGTVSNNQICDQYTGQCNCKDSIEGRTCDVCKEGFYKFPTVTNRPCEPCPCNKGGALPSCNKVTGLCSCKLGVTGPTCDRPKAGFFFPNFTYVSYEPEFSSPNGTFSWYFLIRNYARFFTGLGFAKIDAGQFIKFEFSVPTSARYFTMFRYSLYHLDFYSYMLPQGREKIDWTGSTDKKLYLKDSDNVNNWKFNLIINKINGAISLMSKIFSINDLQLGNDQTWQAENSIALEKQSMYTFMLQYDFQSSQYGAPWPLLLDSILFMLDYNFAPYYASLSSDVIKTELQECFTDSKPIATTYNLPGQCSTHIFTVDLQLFDRALTCDCFQPGSFQWNTCDEFGGQCQCKQGYGRRRCDKCVPGYYGNPTSGCIPCGCSEIGSLSKVCHQETGQCTCKGNAHGLKCDECLIGYFHLSDSNPKGCQECFGYGHLTTCKTAIGFTRSHIFMDFVGVNNFMGWRLRSPFGIDQTNLLLDTSVGMEYTDETNMQYYFDAPKEFLGNQLYSFGQTLKVQLKLATFFERLASTEWHVKLQGNGKTALFKFLEPISQTRQVYSIVLHQEYIINTTKMTEFEFKAMLGQLTALQIGVVYFKSPVTVTLQSVKLSTARYQPSNTDVSLMLSYIEDATCLTGYVGLSCETCAPGYTRLIPNGGPLINCIPCSCNNRSKVCDSQTGVCQNCRPGTKGSYCEKCMKNVLEPSCDQCKPGYWGLYTQTNGCKPCNCHLSGTHNGNTVSCDSSSGQCVCNKTINVGGRQCNVCKENSFNISLGDELRCQECPVCYGLIENSVLLVRQRMFRVEIKVQEVATTVNAMAIIPFFQAITSMQMSLFNVTDRANQGKITSSGLDFLWRTLDDKINIFLTTLQESTMLKVQKLLGAANVIFLTHNSTLFQYSDIHKFLINSYNLVNNTVRARMQQQVIALNQLTNLANEMQRYVTMSTTNANIILTKKYDLKQKIQLSINAAIQARKLASRTRTLAFNLTSSLAPIRTRGLKVELYSRTCVGAIDVWLNNATKALSYSQMILSSIALSIPDHAQNISNLKALTKSLKRNFDNFGTKLFNLQSDINAVALEITKLKTSLHRTQISSAERRSSLLYTNLMILRNKTNQAISSGVEVQREASTMLNTVQNFMSVATNAQSAANGALAKVDSVKRSVESALATAESIRIQIQAPKMISERSLSVMQEANKIVMDENTFIEKLSLSATKLQKQIKSATTLIQGQFIKNYISTSVTPLIRQCMDFKTKTNDALAQAYSAHVKAKQAQASSVTTSQKISLLSTNINQIQILNTGQLDNLLTSISRIKNKYATLQIASGIEILKKAKTDEMTKIGYYRTTNLNLKTKLTVFQLLYNSLASLSC